MNFLVHGCPYYEYMLASLVDGLTELGHNVYDLSGKGLNYMQIFNGQHIDCFIYVPLFSMGDVQSTLPYSVPRVLLWVIDTAEGCMPKNKYSYDIAFYRDLPFDVEYPKCVPFNYGIERRYYEFTKDVVKPLYERSVDITFQGDVFQHGRGIYLSRVDSLKSKYSVRIGYEEKGEYNAYWSGWVNGRFGHWSSYFRLLSNTKIGLSIKGAGPDCGRTWELFASGCAPFIQEYGVKMVDPQLVDGVNCVLFKTPEELIEKLEVYLVNHDKLQAIATEAYAFGKRSHTTKSRAEYFLATLRTMGLIL